MQRHYHRHCATAVTLPLTEIRDHPSHTLAHGLIKIAIYSASLGACLELGLSVLDIQRTKRLPKNGYVSQSALKFRRAKLNCLTAGTDMVLADVVATRPPKDVMEPHGSNPFAMNDGAASQPEKRLSVNQQKALEARRPSVYDPDAYPKPTDEERSTLRRVADSIPAVSYWLCCVKFAERASYYGVQTIFSNFMEFPLPKGKIARFTPDCDDEND